MNFGCQSPGIKELADPRYVFFSEEDLDKNHYVKNKNNLVTKTMFIGNDEFPLDKNTSLDWVSNFKN